MKLYAVCVKAAMKIDGVTYPERMCPVSKVAHLPLNQRGQFKYMPAVFTNKAKAEKWLDRLVGLGGKWRDRYVIIDFDSGFIELEV